MMATMWTVEVGEYSDYKVMCVTHTKAEAERITELYNGTNESTYNNAYIGSLPVISGEPQQVTIYGIQETIWDDGRTEHRQESMSIEWEFDLLWPERNRPVTWRWVRAPMHGGRGGRLEVHGTDLERVRRVFSDRRAQLLAEDAFRARREAVGR